MIGLLSRFNTLSGSLESIKEIYLVAVTATKNGANMTDRFAFLNDSPIDTFLGIVDLCNRRNDYGAATMAGVGMFCLAENNQSYLATHCGTSDSSLVLRRTVGGAECVIGESDYTISIENVKFTPSGRLYQNNGRIIGENGISGWVTVWSSEPIKDYFGLIGTACLQNDNGSHSHFAHGYVKPDGRVGKISNISYVNDKLYISGMITSTDGYLRYQSLLSLDNSNYGVLAEWNTVRLS